MTGLEGLIEWRINGHQLISACFQLQIIEFIPFIIPASVKIKQPTMHIELQICLHGWTLPA